MSNRLNQDREAKLQPLRMQVAKDAITKLGLIITYEDEVKIIFTYKDLPVTFYPYSGWATGKPIRDGRGIENLLKQLR